MNSNKLQKLFAAASQDTGPKPSADFAADTLRVARQQTVPPLRPLASVGGQLNRWFSPVSLACVSVIVLALVLDWGLTAAGFPQPEDSVSQVTAQMFSTSDQM